MLRKIIDIQDIIDPRLLKPPKARAAYSDRTAWVMAELSKLAYIKFEKDKAKLKELKTKLAKFDLTLVSTFDEGGTQAYLARRDKDNLAVLAFRGTECDQMTDIKVDLNIKFFKAMNVKMHTGFKKAFELIQKDVYEKLKTLDGHRLFITGHSLGGALSLMATRAFNSDYIAACYTYGGPRVGNSEFGDKIKIPIYRVVNHVDIVPKVPFFLMGFHHHGDMRYLLNGKAADFSDQRLVANPNPFVRKIDNLMSILTFHFKDFGSDHSIDLYCAKLKAYALKRLDQA